jgi:hypothetical protein
MEQQYIHSLTEKEKQGLTLARNHLGSAFSLEKSVGFIEFVKNESNRANTASESTPQKK